MSSRQTRTRERGRREDDVMDYEMDDDEAENDHYDDHHHSGGGGGIQKTSTNHKESLSRSSRGTGSRGGGGARKAEKFPTSSMHSPPKSATQHSGLSATSHATPSSINNYFESSSFGMPKGSVSAGVGVSRKKWDASRPASQRGGAGTGVTTGVPGIPGVATGVYSNSTQAELRTSAAMLFASPVKKSSHHTNKNNPSISSSNHKNNNNNELLSRSYHPSSSTKKAPHYISPIRREQQARIIREDKEETEGISPAGAGGTAGAKTGGVFDKLDFFLEKSRKRDRHLTRDANGDNDDRSRGGYSTMSKLQKSSSRNNNNNRNSPISRKHPPPQATASVSKKGNNSVAGSVNATNRTRGVARRDSDRSKPSPRPTRGRVERTNSSSRNMDASPKSIATASNGGASSGPPQRGVERNNSTDSEASLHSFMNMSKPRNTKQSLETRSTFTSMSKARKKRENVPTSGAAAINKRQGNTTSSSIRNISTKEEEPAVGEDLVQEELLTFLAMLPKAPSPQQLSRKQKSMRHLHNHNHNQSMSSLNNSSRSLNYASSSARNNNTNDRSMRGSSRRNHRIFDANLETAHSPIKDNNSSRRGRSKSRPRGSGTGSEYSSNQKMLNSSGTGGNRERSVSRHRRTTGGGESQRERERSQSRHRRTTSGGGDSHRERSQSRHRRTTGGGGDSHRERDRSHSRHRRTTGGGDGGDPRGRSHSLPRRSDDKVDADRDRSQSRHRRSGRSKSRPRQTTTTASSSGRDRENDSYRRSRSKSRSRSSATTPNFNKEKSSRRLTPGTPKQSNKTQTRLRSIRVPTSSGAGVPQTPRSSRQSHRSTDSYAEASSTASAIGSTRRLMAVGGSRRHLAAGDVSRRHLVAGDVSRRHLVAGDEKRRSARHFEKERERVAPPTPRTKNDRYERRPVERTKSGGSDRRSHSVDPRGRRSSGEDNTADSRSGGSSDRMNREVPASGRAAKDRDFTRKAPDRTRSRSVSPVTAAKDRYKAMLTKSEDEKDTTMEISNKRVDVLGNRRNTYFTELEVTDRIDFSPGADLDRSIIDHDGVEFLPDPPLKPADHTEVESQLVSGEDESTKKNDTEVDVHLVSKTGDETSRPEAAEVKDNETVDSAHQEGEEPFDLSAEEGVNREETATKEKVEPDASIDDIGGEIKKSPKHKRSFWPFGKKKKEGEKKEGEEPNMAEEVTESATGVSISAKEEELIVPEGKEEVASAKEEDEPVTCIPNAADEPKNAFPVESAPQYDEESVPQEAERTDAEEEDHQDRSVSSRKEEDPTLMQKTDVSPTNPRRLRSDETRTSDHTRNTEPESLSEGAAEEPQVDYNEEDIFSFYSWSTAKQNSRKIQIERMQLKDSIRDTALYRAFQRVNT